MEGETMKMGKFSVLRMNNMAVLLLSSGCLLFAAVYWAQDPAAVGYMTCVAEYQLPNTTFPHGSFKNSMTYRLPGHTNDEPTEVNTTLEGGCYPRPEWKTCVTKQITLSMSANGYASRMYESPDAHASFEVKTPACAPGFHLLGSIPAYGGNVEKNGTNKGSFEPFDWISQRWCVVGYTPSTSKSPDKKTLKGTLTCSGEYQ